MPIDKRTFFYTDKPSEGPGMADMTVFKIFHLAQHWHLLIETCFPWKLSMYTKGERHCLKL